MDRETINENARIWRKKHPGYGYKISKKWREERPWMSHHNSAEQRCNNPKKEAYKYYGAKGIRFELTTNDVKDLWFRDKAYLMKRASIDRINSDGNYAKNNCRFIELSVNSSRHKLSPYAKKVAQLSLSGVIVKKFNSIAESGRLTGINYRSISACALGKKNYHTAGGFKWMYVR